MDYIKRMFSWNGYAGRKEYAGFFLLTLGILSLTIIVPILISGLFKLEIGNGYKTTAVIFSIISVVISFFASARRIRHIGFSPWLAVPVAVLSLLPSLSMIGFLLMALLCFVPSLKNPKLPADDKHFFSTNIAVFIAGFVAPIVFMLGLSYLVRTNPKALTVFPAFKQAAESDSYSKAGVNPDRRKNILPPAMPKAMPAGHSK